MEIKVKIGAIDMDGFCGRDSHPEADDEGKIGRLVSMEPMEGNELHIFLVRLDDGRLVELVDFEIEAIAGPFWNEPEALPPVVEVKAGLGTWEEKS